MGLVESGNGTSGVVEIRLGGLGNEGSGHLRMRLVVVWE